MNGDGDDDPELQLALALSMAEVRERAREAGDVARRRTDLVVSFFREAYVFMVPSKRISQLHGLLVLTITRMLVRQQQANGQPVDANMAAALAAALGAAVGGACLRCCVRLLLQWMWLDVCVCVGAKCHLSV
jgi:hypothetical protein